MEEVMPRYPRHVPSMGRTSDEQVKYRFLRPRSTKEALRVFGRDRAWRNSGSNADNGRPIRSLESAFAFLQPSLAKNGPVKQLSVERYVVRWYGASPDTFTYKRARGHHSLPLVGHFHGGMAGRRKNCAPVHACGATSRRRTAACPWKKKGAPARMSVGTTTWYLHPRRYHRRWPSSTSRSVQRSTRKAWTRIEMAWTPKKSLGMILEQQGHGAPSSYIPEPFCEIEALQYLPFFFPYELLPNWTYEIIRRGRSKYNKLGDTVLSYDQECTPVMLLRAFECFTYMLLYRGYNTKFSWQVINVEKDPMAVLFCLSKYLCRKDFDRILEFSADSGDPHWELRKFWDAWNAHASKHYTPSRLLGVDEAMFKWTGMYMSFRICVRRKSDPLGHELKTVCDGAGWSVFLHGNCGERSFDEREESLYRIWHNHGKSPQAYDAFRWEWTYMLG
eukprot:scaffold644_cov357-Pavlova_lutheri.AAC.2